MYPGRHPGVDQRTRGARAYKAACKALVAEIGNPSQPTMALITATATAMAACSEIQAKVLTGAVTTAELGELAKLGNLVSRNLTLLGLKTRRKATPSLADYIARHSDG